MPMIVLVGKYFLDRIRIAVIFLKSYIYFCPTFMKLKKSTGFSLASLLQIKYLISVLTCALEIIYWGI